MAGAVGGLAGGIVALRLDDEPAPAATTVAAPPATPAPDEDARLRTAIARVSPAVVTVVVNLPPTTDAEGRVIDRQNFGSGIVVSTQGHIVTNFHVIDGAAAIDVVLSTGERRPAVIVADDSPFTDLAILLVDPTGLRTAALGDSDALEFGQPLAAIASGILTPENQVKLGVFSARQSAFPRDGVILLDMIQTDAAVNHGDSGGALIDADGLVVGMLTTVVRTSGGFDVEGVALAQSANSIRPVVDAVVETGVNPRPRIGVERVNAQHLVIDEALDAEVRAQLGDEQGLPVADGALIVSVDPGSPAETAGIRPGDIVVGVDGVPIDAERPFANLLGLARTGVELQLDVLRDGEQFVIPVVPQLIAGVPS